MKPKSRSTRLLKIDHEFVPCPMQEGDELFRNGIFIFNITKLVEDARLNPENYSFEELEVDSSYTVFSTIDEDHLDLVDTSIPIIIAEIAPGQFTVIDGNHRMEKACGTGMKSLPAYRLTPEQHIVYLTTKKGYTAYIDYWNEKLMR